MDSHCTSHQCLFWSHSDGWEKCFLCVCICITLPLFISLCVCIKVVCVRVCVCTSHHSELSNHTCMCVVPLWKALYMKLQTEWGRQKESSQTSPPFVSHADWAVESPRGKQGYNMCIRPHNIIYNRQTHFHTNGFHHRGSPLALKERGHKRQGGEREALLLQ